MSTRKPIHQQISELDAKRQLLVARQKKEQRTKDTRRKILLGALVLNRIGEDSKSARNLRAWLKRDLPGYLTRPSDLNLFEDLLGGKDDEADSENVTGNEAAA